MKIRAPRDFLSGAFFLVIGSAFAIIAGRYPIGSAVDMGPGYIPNLLGWFLAFLGVILLGRSLFLGGPELSSINWRGLIVITLSIVVFGLSYSWLGLVAAIAVAVVLACLASPESALIESIVTAVLLSLLTTFLFVHVLKLPLHVWPMW